MKRTSVWLLLCGILFVITTCTGPPATPAPTPTPTPIPILSSELIAEIDTFLADSAQQKLFSGAVLIAEQGTVLLSQGYGLADRQQSLPNTPQTRYRLASITKQFTAMGILVLAAQGKLSVSDPICNHLADCPAAWEAITIEHLLTHTSGINYRPSPLDPPLSLEEEIARYKETPLNFQPGERWEYSNAGYALLGHIIERASGMAYAEFLQQAIFTPLDLQDTGYAYDLNGLAVGYANRSSNLPAEYVDAHAAGGLYATVEDLYRWEQSLYTEKLVPQRYLDAMFAPHATMPDSEGWSYGYGWSIGTERGRPIHAHSGGILGYASIIARYPESRITIIMLSNQLQPHVTVVYDVLTKKVFGDE